MQPPSPSTTTSTTTSTVHDNNREDDENGSNLDTDLSGDAAFYGSGMGGPMVRSASEEALPVSLSCDFTVSGKLNLKNTDLKKLGSESYNGLNSNQHFNTYAVLPTHCADQTVIAGTTTATAITSTTAGTSDPIPSTSAAADAESTTASAAADSKQLLHSPPTLDRKSTTTISRFTVTLVSQEVKTETNDQDNWESKDRQSRDRGDRTDRNDKNDKQVNKAKDDRKKCTKKKTRKKYPEYNV